MLFSKNCHLDYKSIYALLLQSSHDFSLITRENRKYARLSNRAVCPAHHMVLEGRFFLEKNRLSTRKTATSIYQGLSARAPPPTWA